MEKEITIAIIGGTGSLGRGLTLRLARPEIKVIVGSRDQGRARQAADELNRILGKELIAGKLNSEAIQEAGLIIVAVPYEGHEQMVRELGNGLKNKIVVDAVVPLRKGKPFVPPAGSALQEAQAILGSDVSVVGALHNISALDLQDSPSSLGDVLVCGDSDVAKQKVMEIIQMLGARPFDAGPAANAYVIEGLTGVLIYLNRKYKSKHASVKVTGIGG
jgi:NADPH-dependent F420 reductase